MKCPCSKRIYGTSRLAIRYALKYSADRGVALRVYRCPDKAGWHLTKKRNW